MKNNLDETLQWLGAVFIIVGHTLNAVGPAAYPWNIVSFFVGTVAFLWWSLRVTNRPQILVNVVAISISLIGIVNAWH